jgi:hypothetical protein
MSSKTWEVRKVAGHAPLHGLIAEFEDPTSLVAAAHRAHDDGYRCLDAYSPFPIEELHDALGMHHTRLPLIVLIGGIVGGLGGYALQYWASAIAYPVNIGGKPLHSWPAFIPITFECTILVAALSGGARHAGIERLAAAVPSGIQRGTVRARQPKPVLPVHRSARSEVRSRRDATISRDAQSAEVTTVAD